MIVNNIKELKDNKYLVTIDDNDYTFDIDVVLKYRLVNGKEIDNKILKEAIYNNDLSKYYNRTLKYAVRYNKSEKEIYYYLLDLQLNNNDINKIIERLKENSIINDKLLIKSEIDSLVRSYNGKLMIKEKLKNHKFNIDLINQELELIDEELYFECLNKLLIKTQEKYKKETDDFIRLNKIKRYLYQRGYSNFDIEKVMKWKKYFIF